VELGTGPARVSPGAVRNDRYERDMKIIPMPLPWPNVWWLCTLDLDPDDGVRRFGAFHREETASEVVAGPEEHWAFGVPVRT